MSITCESIIKKNFFVASFHLDVVHNNNNNNNKNFFFLLSVLYYSIYMHNQKRKMISVSVQRFT
jgi:hypothetical protein